MMVKVVKMVVKVVKMVVKVVKICYTCFCTGSSSQLRSVKDTGQPHLLNAQFGSNFLTFKLCQKNRVMLPSCPAASTQLQDLLHGSIKFLSFYPQTPRVLCPRGGFNIFTTFVLYIEVREVEFRAPLEVEMSKRVHTVVARSVFRSQNCKKLTGSEHFWKLKCRKSARRGGTKHISKLKC